MIKHPPILHPPQSIFVRSHRVSFASTAYGFGTVSCIETVSLSIRIRHRSFQRYSLIVSPARMTTVLSRSIKVSTRSTSLSRSLIVSTGISLIVVQPVRNNDAKMTNPIKIAPRLTAPSPRAAATASSFHFFIACGLLPAPDFSFLGSPALQAG